MNIENFKALTGPAPGDERREEVRREKTATDFEELFARHLVQEMTRNTFNMTDEASGMGQSNALYREFITDALAGELAAQRKLGMAEMVKKYWDRSPDPAIGGVEPGREAAANSNTDEAAAGSNTDHERKL